MKLRKFKKSQLLYNEKETVAILKFIFKNNNSVINKLTINDEIREFAQGLLLEAVDASYAMGFVEAIFRSSMNPGAGAKKIITKFGKKAIKHWFKHATAKDLRDIKIYEIVRSQLQANFGRILVMHSLGIAMNKINQATTIAANSTKYRSKKNSVVWG